MLIDTHFQKLLSFTNSRAVTLHVLLTVPKVCRLLSHATGFKGSLCDNDCVRSLYTRHAAHNEDRSKAY
jgi:hypothetical protein